MRILLPTLAALAAALLPATPGAAQEVRRPLLEAGIIGGAGLLPDYPAAEDSQVRALALPWVIYRGELVQSDERGLRGRLYRATDLELTLNVNGAVGTGSRSGTVREGMEDLDWLGEVGPSLRYTAWRDAARRSRVTLELPVRAAFGTDFSRIRHRGFVVAPEAAYERSGLFGTEARGRIGIGPVFASGALMDHWYRVKPSEARPGRPAFNGDGGYLGTRLQFSLRMPVSERVWLSAGGRVENFSGAANADSPLFRSEWNVSLVGGVSVTLYSSTATAASTAEPFD